MKFKSKSGTQTGTPAEGSTPVQHSQTAMTGTRRTSSVIRDTFIKGQLVKIMTFTKQLIRVRFLGGLCLNFKVFHIKDSKIQRCCIEARQQSYTKLDPVSECSDRHLRPYRCTAWLMTGMDGIQPTFIGTFARGHEIYQNSHSRSTYRTLSSLSPVT